MHMDRASSSRRAADAVVRRLPGKPRGESPFGMELAELLAEFDPHDFHVRSYMDRGLNARIARRWAVSPRD